MAGRFINPFPQYLDATPVVRAGAKLFFYAAGTSTKLTTYSDRSLSSANTNPVVLNSAGYPSVDIYLQDLDYKVVLAPSTDTDPPTSPIWSADYVRSRDSALVAKTLTGSGSPNGSVAGTAGSASILPDFYWDYTNSILYVCTTTGTTSTAVWTAVNASTAAAVVPAPQGYLTLTSGTPIIASDVAAATSVYYTPYVGNLVPIYNGSSFAPTVFTELTLTLSSSHAASNIYDVFVFNNSGVPTIVTGPSWSAGTGGSITTGSCARGTGAGGAAIARINGIWTNTVQITGRNGATTYTINANLATYVGSIFMDGTNGQITCHRSWGQSRKWGVWNAWNRAPIFVKGGTSVASSTSSSVTPVPISGDTTASVMVFEGLPEEIVNARAYIRASSLAAAAGVQAGVGWNATNAFSGVALMSGNGGTNAITGSATGEYNVVPSVGLNLVNLVAASLATGTTTFTNGEANNAVIVGWRG